MLNNRNQRLLISTLLLVSVLASPALATEAIKQLGEGVTLTQEIAVDCQVPLIVNTVTVDMSNPGVRVKAAIGMDVIYTDGWQKGREAVSSLTRRTKAAAGINADFFPFTGDPLGMCIVDGELVSEPGSNRVALGVLTNGGVFFDNPRLDAKLTLQRGVSRQIDGLNRGRETNQLIAYTSRFGDSTQSKYKGTDVVLETEIGRAHV